MLTVSLLGLTLPVVLPDYTTRRELFQSTAYAEGPRLYRVCGAAIGLCTGAPLDEKGKPIAGGRTLARQARADYAAAKFDALSFGGDVYEYLRLAGAEDGDIVAAANTILELVRDNQFPSPEATAAKQVFSGPTAG